jgi:hypothetical protein
MSSLPTTAGLYHLDMPSGPCEARLSIITFVIFFNSVYFLVFYIYLLIYFMGLYVYFIG